MSAMRLIGLVILVPGVLMLGYSGFTYTTREKVVDIGPVEVTKNTRHSVPLGPVAGVIAIVAGIALIASDRKKLV